MFRIPDSQKRKPKGTERAGMKAEIWILPHQYSCGGYWIASRCPAGIDYHDSVKGVVYNDDLSFWLLSHNQVLSEHQARHAMDYRRSLGEEITEVWADSLPEGARILNSRNRN